MDIAAYNTDIEYLYQKLKKHPAFIRTPGKLHEFEQLYAEISEIQTSYYDMIDAMNRLTCFFGDGHTNIELPYTSKDLCINVPCRWCCDGLVLKYGFNGIAAETEIIGVENLSVNELVDLMKHRIPHENNYLVKSRMINYPYKNYHVFSQMNLAALFGKKDGYKITFLTANDTKTVLCELKEYNGYLNFNEDAFVSIEVDDDVAILHLDACICNEKYIDSLDKLVALCEEREIKTLVLDLSKNMGGDSSVIDKFIQYVNVDEFYRYGMTDYSSGIGKQITDRTHKVRNIKKEKCFNCNILCRVSCNTFSSARTFAVTLKDNGIAGIIGSPTGGKPSSYGYPKRYTTPNIGVTFRISRAYFSRPDTSTDCMLTLLPDNEAV